MTGSVDRYIYHTHYFKVPVFVKLVFLIKFDLVRNLESGNALILTNNPPMTCKETSLSFIVSSSLGTFAENGLYALQGAHKLT
jgi:hypothetical protein